MDTASSDSSQHFPPYYVASLEVEEYELPKLSFGEKDLEPYLTSQTYNAHYLGHHKAYTTKMNAVEKEWAEEFPNDKFASKSVLDQMKDLKKIPEKYRTRFIQNAGGYINHAMYWACMSANEKGEVREPTGKLRDEINSTFGSFDAFKEKFTAEAVALFGSGYVWLVRQSDAAGGGLKIMTTANQDCPLSAGHVPVLVIDVWEHAYYLQWEFRRPKYVSNWWMLVDWKNVADMYSFFSTGKLARL